MHADPRVRSVGAVAALTDTSVRTLHHYDDAEPGLAQFVHDIIVQSVAG